MNFLEAISPCLLVFRIFGTIYFISDKKGFFIKHRGWQCYCIIFFILFVYLRGSLLLQKYFDSELFKDITNISNFFTDFTLLFLCAVGIWSIQVQNKDIFRNLFVVKQIFQQTSSHMKLIYKFNVFFVVFNFLAIFPFYIFVSCALEVINKKGFAIYFFGDIVFCILQIYCVSFLNTSRILFVLFNKNMFEKFSKTSKCMSGRDQMNQIKSMRIFHEVIIQFSHELNSIFGPIFLLTTLNIFCDLSTTASFIFHHKEFIGLWGNVIWFLIRSLQFFTIILISDTARTEVGLSFLYFNVV